MVAIIYLLNLLGPIITIAGLFGLAGLMQGELDDSLWVVSGICGIVGVLFGIKAWSYGVPPRWFWAKSQVDLFGSKVSCCFTHMVRFFFLPLAIAFAIEVFG